MLTDVRDTEAVVKDPVTLRSADRRTLDTIFRHHTPQNLEWRDVVDLVSHIGSAEERSNDTFVFAIDAEWHSMRKPHTGEANMAAQLTAYLETHHPKTYERVVKEIVADLPNRTTAELIDLGRHALVSTQ